MDGLYYVSDDDINCTCSGPVINHKCPLPTNPTGRGWINLGRHGNLSPACYEALEKLEAVAMYKSELRVRCNGATEEDLDAPWFNEYLHKALQNNDTTLKIKVHKIDFARSDEFEVNAVTAFCLRGKGHSSLTRAFHIDELTIAKDIRRAKLGWFLGPCITRHWISNMRAKMRATGTTPYPLVKACSELFVASLWQDGAARIGATRPILQGLGRLLTCPMNEDVGSYEEPANPIKILGFVAGLKYGAVVGHALDLLDENTRRSNHKTDWLRFGKSATGVATTAAKVAGDVFKLPGASGIATIVDGVAVIGDMYIDRTERKYEGKAKQLHGQIVDIVEEFNRDVLQAALQGRIENFASTPTQHDAVLFRAVAANTFAIVTIDWDLRIHNKITSQDALIVKQATQDAPKPAEPGAYAPSQALLQITH